MSRILIVEDHLAYAEEVKGYLSDKGHEAHGVSTAAAMWNQLVEYRADIVLLDLGLPDDDGGFLVPQLRSRYPEMGIVVVTARVSQQTRVEALILGADHFLTKPIKLSELNAVVIALGRRLEKTAVAVRQDSWTLFPKSRELRYGLEARVSLSERESQFLELIVRSPQGLTRNATLVAFGEALNEDSRRRLDNLIYRLRRKVQEHFQIALPIKASYGGGYCLIDDFFISNN